MPPNLPCKCGNPASARCSRTLCARCCSDPSCPRHGNGNSNVNRPTNKRKRPAAPSEDSEQQGQYCPRCWFSNKGRLVLRRNRSTGEEFWGCSGYPRCKYSKNKAIPEEDWLRMWMKGSHPHSGGPCEECGQGLVLSHGEWGPYYRCFENFCGNTSVKKRAKQVARKLGVSAVAAIDEKLVEGLFDGATLKAEAAAMGLKTKGTKAQLAARILGKEPPEPPPKAKPKPKQPESGFGFGFGFGSGSGAGPGVPMSHSEHGTLSVNVRQGQSQAGASSSVVDHSSSGSVSSGKCRAIQASNNERCRNRATRGKFCGRHTNWAASGNDWVRDCAAVVKSSGKRCDKCCKPSSRFCGSHQQWDLRGGQVAPHPPPSAPLVGHNNNTLVAHTCDNNNNNNNPFTGIAIPLAAAMANQQPAVAAAAPAAAAATVALGHSRRGSSIDMPPLEIDPEHHRQREEQQQKQKHQRQAHTHDVTLSGCSLQMLNGTYLHEKKLRKQGPRPRFVKLSPLSSSGRLHFHHTQTEGQGRWAVSEEISSSYRAFVDSDALFPQLIDASGTHWFVFNHTWRPERLRVDVHVHHHDVQVKSSDVQVKSSSSEAHVCSESGSQYAYQYQHRNQRTLHDEQQQVVSNGKNLAHADPPPPDYERKVVVEDDDNATVVESTSGDDGVEGEGEIGLQAQTTTIAKKEQKK